MHSESDPEDWHAYGCCIFGHGAESRLWCRRERTPARDRRLQYGSPVAKNKERRQSAPVFYFLSAFTSLCYGGCCCCNRRLIHFDPFSL